MFDALSSVGGPAAYVIVSLLVALEASAFVGLFIPGELALLSGGYIAHQHNAGLGIMMGAAALGAIVGDSVGYEIGRHLGPGLQRSRLGAKVGRERWRRAEAYLGSNGGRAVLGGRFIGVLRALVPAIAGATGMPYRRFLFWNAAGALVWAPGMVFAGYTAGSSYRRVEHYAGQAGLLLLGLGATVASVVLVGRWIARHPDQVRSVVVRQLERPRLAALTNRHRNRLHFLADRFRPGNALGLALTGRLAVLTAIGWILGSLIQDVVGGDDSVRIDVPVARYLAAHRVGWLTTTMSDLTVLGSSTVLIALVAVVGIVVRRRTDRWSVMTNLLLGLGGAIVLCDLIKPLVGRARPQIGAVVAVAPGYAFPSAHTTQTTAVAVTLAMLSAAAMDRWSRKVAVWCAAVVVCLVVGFSRLYLGVHWTTDVLAGYALGSAWAWIVLLATRTSRHAVAPRAIDTAASTA